jgi:hypothetical protein
MEKEQTKKELRVNESCDVCYVSDEEEIIEKGVISEITDNLDEQFHKYSSEFGDVTLVSDDKLSVAP